MQKRNYKQGRYMKAKRSSTVEPVFGILTQFMGLAKVNTLGIQQANKCMLMAAIAYNLKKYLKYTTKKAHSNQGNTRLLTMAIKAFLKVHKPLVSLPQN
ncbi:transposase [Pustulibacterium marinum]|uniref:transposase n=1 Tax=Pustulibacterium marinum TaxID=1224947 RepID=UPI0021D12C9E|nr:transposase [Pustulibacterium marinum]